MYLYEFKKLVKPDNRTVVIMRIYLQKRSSEFKSQVSFSNEEEYDRFVRKAAFICKSYIHFLYLEVDKVLHALYGDRYIIPISENQLFVNFVKVDKDEQYDSDMNENSILFSTCGKYKVVAADKINKNPICVSKIIRISFKASLDGSYIAKVIYSDYLSGLEFVLRSSANITSQEGQPG